MQSIVIYVSACKGPAAGIEGDKVLRELTFIYVHLDQCSNRLARVWNLLPIHWILTEAYVSVDQEHNSYR